MAMSNPFQDVDPSLMVRTFGCTLVLGRSGTGKSSLLKHIATNLEKKTTLYLINVRADEISEYTKIHKNTVSASLDTVHKASKNSYVFVEDIIQLSKQHEKKLRHLLNYDAHHRSQKVFCIAHTIHKNDIFGMLSLFHYIVFTSSPSNEPVIRFTLNYFKIDKNMILTWLEHYKNPKFNKISIYFFFDCTKMFFACSENMLEANTFKIIGSTSNFTSTTFQTEADNINQLKKTLEQKFEKFIEGHPLKLQASAIFNIIINCINIHQISETDLTMHFGQTRSKLPKKVSIVDYIFSLISLQSEKAGPPPNELLAMHKYVSTLCIIPTIFIKNNHFIHL